MKESQTIEFKETWHDEYLKWLCGFANAEGGILSIGRNDQGVSIGVPNAAKLMEDLPNKIRDTLGIMADVRLKQDGGKEVIEIQVDPYPAPISYKGEFHYRSGSTKQVLKGAALERFLLSKQGRHWDGVPVPYVTEDDLDADAFKNFRQTAAKSGRMGPTVLEDPPHCILENLNLLEGGLLRRAAVLLFHENPERFIPGAYVKIGFFRTDADLAYQDEVHGPLFTQAHKTLDLLLTKYMKAYIHYEGLTRVERFLFPPEALRELILNALVHRDYGSGTPVQIRVYEDQLWIANDGLLPAGWTIEHLLSSHTSKPHNPLIAGAFFRTGDIESWGRGIDKVRAACRQSGTEFPAFRFESTGLVVFFKSRVPTEASLAASDNARSAVSSGEKWGEKWGEQLGKHALPILKLIAENNRITIVSLSKATGLSTSGVEKIINRLKEHGLLRRIGPAKGGHWEVYNPQNGSAENE